MGEEDEVHQTRHQRRDGDGPNHRAAAVFLLQPRADQQQQQHIAHVVLIAGVTQHVAEEADVGQRISQGGAVDGEELGGGRAVCPLAQQQRDEAQQGEGQDHRRVEANDDLFQDEYLFSNAFKGSILYL